MMKWLNRKEVKASDAVKLKDRLSRKVDKRSKALRRFSVTATILFIAILLILNLVFDSVLGERLRWDWTSEGLYSIGDVTRDIISGMDKDVEIVGLFDVDTDTRYSRIRPMLDEYVKQSDGRITLRYVNPDRFPGIIDELDPEGYIKPEANTFVVTSKETGKATVVTEADIFSYQVDYTTYNQYLDGITTEQSFTGAIKYVLSETTPVVYFTTGHEEISHEEQYSMLVTILNSNNYDVSTLDLFDLENIPEDCSVLVMASPKIDISPRSRGLILDYLRQGGSMLVISDYNTAEFPELNTLLFEFNLELSNNKIREGDRDHRYQDDPYVIRAIAPAGSVTETLVDGWTLVENVRGVNELFNTKDWVTVEPVLVTTDQGVAEIKADPEQSSAPGVQNMAMLSENRGWMGSNVSESAKMMVVGSSSAFNDQLLQSFGTNIYNASLFYYSIQWLSGADQGESLYIQAKMPPSYVVTRGTQTTHVFTAVLVMILIPLALLLAALIIYRKRKHL